MVVKPYNRKKQTTDIPKNMDKTQKHFTEEGGKDIKMHTEWPISIKSIEKAQ